MGGIAERSVGARGFGHVMLECTDRLTVVQTLIQYPEWVGNRSDRKGCSFPSTTFDLGRRVLAWTSTTAGGRWECDRGGRALPAEVEFTAIQCGVYSCVHFRLLVCVRDRQLVSAVAGLCVFPGCAVATLRTGVPSQGQCIPPIARARFGAPRRCDALRFLLPLQAVKKTAISQKAQRERDTTVASRYTGCWHTRCRQSTRPRFHGTACSEARCIPQAM